MSAASIECIHAYSLVHDDLPGMGRTTRCAAANQPTTSSTASAWQPSLATACRLRAFENITGYWLAQNKPEIGLRAAHELAIGAGNQGMVVGQAQDLLAEGKHIDEANMKYIHAHKTGAPHHGLCAHRGHHRRLRNAEQLAALSRYGQHIGLAFQITDDILDRCRRRSRHRQACRQR